MLGCGSSLTGRETGKMSRLEGGEDGEACCCPRVGTVPLTMVHFSEKGG